MVLKFLGEMQNKCSQGPDGISTKLLKLIIPHILSPLTHCFNLSFQQAFVAPPVCSARVIPVYKSGKRDDYSNYRPISLLRHTLRSKSEVWSTLSQKVKSPNLSIKMAPNFCHHFPWCCSFPKI